MLNKHITNQYDFIEDKNNKFYADLRVLTQDKSEKIDRFKKILSHQKVVDGKKWFEMAVVKYRCELLGERKEVIPVLKLILAYEKKNYGDLRDMLGELFMQYINDSELELLIKKLNQKKTTLSTIYEKHMTKPEHRLLRLI